MNDVTYLVLDCNILLHFAPPDQIDWLALCESNEVRIVLYPKLLSEVSKAKDMNPRKHLRDRAATRERWLDEKLNQTSAIRPSVFIVADPEEHRDILVELGLDRVIADDAIVAQAVCQQRLGRNVCVATADRGLRMQLQHRQIRVVVPDDRHKVAAEPDPERIRADRLSQQLIELQNRLPAFRANLKGSNNVELVHNSEAEQSFIQKAIDDLNQQYEQRQQEQNRRLGQFFPTSTLRNLSTIEQANLYHFLGQFYSWKQKIDGTRPVEILLENFGHTVAHNVRITPEMSDEIKFYLRKEICTSPDRDALSDAVRMLRLEGSSYFPADARSFRSFTPLVTSTRLSGGQIHWTRDRIGHQDSTVLPDLCLQSSPDAEIGLKQLTLTVLSDELSVPQILQIPVRLV